MTDAMIQGVGMTAFGRHPDRSVRSLAEEAVRAALADAGLQARDVGAVIFGNAVQGAMEGQFGIRGQIALRDMDFDAVPIINVENACASASTALNLAVMHVTSGACDVALAVGAEKMVHPDTARSMEAFEGSWERADREGAIARLTDLGKRMPADLDALCLSRLARFKRPKRYEVLRDLPRNSAGKVLKTALRARFGGTAG